MPYFAVGHQRVLVPSLACYATRTPVNPAGVTVDHKADSAYLLLLSVQVPYAGQQLVDLSIEFLYNLKLRCCKRCSHFSLDLTGCAVQAIL